MNARFSPLAAVAFGAALLALGFAVGYGFHTSQSVSSNTPANQTNAGANNAFDAAPSSTGNATKTPPIVKGLHLSPDGKRVAFTAVYANGERASRFVLDIQSGNYEAREAPRGWQDFVIQWSRDGRSLLFDREKIPDDVAETQPGLHEENLAQKSEPRALTPPKSLSSGEKSVAGFWTPGGELIVKTRREPKTLFLVKNGKARVIDHANVTYFQNRVVRENGRDVFYVVRDVAGQQNQNALFRVENGRARQISPNLGKMTWAYVAENARWMIVCRTQQSSSYWNWTLYRVAPNAATVSSTRNVPSDVISVFWSPDFKRILGASGDKLWTVDVPTLQTRQIGKRDTWSADDAGWLPRQNAILVASRGQLWHVDLNNGNARAIWKFPAKYWK